MVSVIVTSFICSFKEPFSGNTGLGLCIFRKGAGVLQAVSIRGGYQKSYNGENNDRSKNDDFYLSGLASNEFVHQKRRERDGEGKGWEIMVKESSPADDGEEWNERKHVPAE